MRGTGPLLGLILIVVALVVACQSSVPTAIPASPATSNTDSSARATPVGDASPEPSGLIVLTSPGPRAPEGLADGSSPAYQADTGFTPDAVRVLTFLSIQIAVEQYRAANGDYPQALDELFPAFAPLGEDGQPLTAPPDGYEYSAAGAAYSLSVTLESGQQFMVHGGH